MAALSPATQGFPGHSFQRQTVIQKELWISQGSVRKTETTPCTPNIKVFNTGNEEQQLRPPLRRTGETMVRKAATNNLKAADLPELTWSYLIS